MRKGIVGLASCVVLSGVWLMADDRGGGGDDRVKELERRVEAAETELAKAKELLAAIRGSSQDTRSLEGVWRIVSINGNRPGGSWSGPLTMSTRSCPPVIISGSRSTRDGEGPPVGRRHLHPEGRKIQGARRLLERRGPAGRGRPGLRRDLPAGRQALVPLRPHAQRRDFDELWERVELTGIERTGTIRAAGGFP